MPAKQTIATKPNGVSVARWGKSRTAVLVALVAGVAFFLGSLGTRNSSLGLSHSAIEPVLQKTEWDENHVLTGDAAAQFCLLLLENAERRLERVSDVTARFHKMERIDGVVQELNVMDLKVRRAPLSVYMRWDTPHNGREIIWQENANDGQIVVHAGGWRRKLVPILHIDPYGERAMEYNRRPVTQIGLWNFNARLLENLRKDLARPEVKVWMTQDRRISDRPCYCFHVLHEARAADLEYHKMLAYVDKELIVPVACELYGWASDGTPDALPLEESYAFCDLTLNAGLSDLDFDPANPEYEYGTR